MNSREGRPKTRADGDKRAGTMLTMREACMLLNVHGNTLRRWSDRGLVKAYRLGVSQHRRFRTEDIAALVTEQKATASTDHDKL
jgi:excisionase family DNA binding protein